MTVWQANGSATDEKFGDFAVSMLTIFTNLMASSSAPVNLIGASRAISVELRKVLLDGLLPRCVSKPRLAPLVSTEQLKGDSLEDVFEVSSSRIELIKQDEPMARERAVVLCAPVTHTTAIHPMYGLRFDADTDCWVSVSPFDPQRRHLRLDRWLKQPVLQINDDVYDMRAILSEVANTQGAHSDHKKDFIRQRIQQFLRSSYLNVFTLAVGIWLLNQFASSLLGGSSLRERVTTICPEAAEAISEVESVFLFDRDQFLVPKEVALHPVAVIQNVPLVGGVPEYRHEPLLAMGRVSLRSEISAPGWQRSTLTAR